MKNIEAQSREKETNVQLLKAEIDSLNKINEDLREQNKKLYDQQSNLMHKFGDKADEAI